MLQLYEGFAIWYWIKNWKLHKVFFELWGMSICCLMRSQICLDKSWMCLDQTWVLRWGKVEKCWSQLARELIIFNVMTMRLRVKKGQLGCKRSWLRMHNSEKIRRWQRRSFKALDTFSCRHSQPQVFSF